MIVNKEDTICSITQENASIQKLVRTIEDNYDNYKNYHIIVTLSSLETIPLDDIIEFLRLSNRHRGDKKSFVVVSSNVDFDATPDEICVVPTLHEAYDIIEMEDIERDLGF